MAIQPSEYCQKNNLNHLESNVVKYVSRHRQKNGPEDIKKAIHCLELLLEIDYPDKDRLEQSLVNRNPVTEKESFPKLVAEVGGQLPSGKSLAEFLEEEANRDNFDIGCDTEEGQDKSITEVYVNGKDIMDHVKEALDIINRNREPKQEKLHIAVFAKTQEGFLSKIPQNTTAYNNGVEYIRESSAAFWHRIKDPVNTVSWDFDGHIYYHDCGSEDSEFLLVVRNYKDKKLMPCEVEGIKVYLQKSKHEQLKNQLK